ncbi:MAG: isoleucine--tRNA ligase, partial [Bacilli bacterium]|nr:isoleucine--tRNA ligase [Bacilli bacterium]
PPFATGMPHYGHLTAGGLKDVVTRYWVMKGRSCVRRFGWDCHGLPIEVIINKKLGIKTKKDLMKLGIDNYNAECRKIIMTYAEDWKYYTERFGRWIDFENDYRTMYPSFMETCWWIFKQIYEKGRVYRKCKVMPFSCATNTVLSNFEAGENYKNTEDPSIVITFPLLSDNKRKILAWTTTPWTLPSNLFLTVNPKVTYVEIKTKVKDEEVFYILAESRLEEVLKMIKIKEGEYEIVDKKLGEQLAGLEYVPLFNYFYDQYKPRGCFKVYNADYVTTEDGTGVVHNAPGFGEDDYSVGCQYKLVDPEDPVCPMDEDGCFTEDVPDYKGMYFKSTDQLVMERLKKDGRLLFKGTITHSYPFCYRTDTPLMYRAIPSWFIKVEDLRERLVAINNSTYWVPKYVQEKRFGNWLANARDWCISRNRSWGTPIPLWVSDDLEEQVPIGSIKELEELSGVKGIKDIHREYVDNITIPSKKGKGVLHRIPEVFDCWYESGSMPYGQVHYPFDVKDEEFMKGFPADFIAEGLDQTRGWFYTLNLVSTILFDKTPYQNLIVNGLVLDEKGDKLSKHKGNFKDPKELFDNYGADVVRLYLIDSPLVRAQ